MECLVTFRNSSYLKQPPQIGELQFFKSVIHFDNNVKLLNNKSYDATDILWTMGKKNSKLKQDTIDRLTTDTYCKCAFNII